MTDIQTPESNEPETMVPDDYQIPQDIIQSWNALEKNYTFEPKLPRAAWDRLYQAILDINNATISSMSLIAAMFGSDKEKSESEIQKFTAKHIEAQNSLRQFQQALMMVAIDENKKVSENG